VSPIDCLFDDLVSGDELALDALLKSSDADHRWWAVRTLAQIAKIDADCFIEALNDVHRKCARPRRWLLSAP